VSNNGADEDSVAKPLLSKFGDVMLSRITDNPEQIVTIARRQGKLSHSPKRGRQRHMLINRCRMQGMWVYTCSDSFAHLKQ
jgi:hypothetical protein